MRVGAQQNPNDVHFCLSVALLPISRSGHSRQSARHSKLVGKGTIYFSQMTQTAEGTAHCIETPCYTMKAWPVTPDFPYCQRITTRQPVQPVNVHQRLDVGDV